LGVIRVTSRGIFPRIVRENSEPVERRALRGIDGDRRRSGARNVDGEGEVKRKRCSVFIGYGSNDGICGYGIRESGAAGDDGIGCNYSSGRRRESWISRHHRHRAVRATDERWWGDEV